MNQNIIIPKTDLTVAPLGLGTVKAGLSWDGKDADRIFDAFLDMNGNVIDCARVYSDWIPPEKGRAERVVGDWLHRSKKRDRIVLITKGGHPEMKGKWMSELRLKQSDMRHDLELSLQALHTDYIDIYLYHRDDPSIPVAYLIDTMEQFVKEGKIRYYGCSNWSTERMAEADIYAKATGYRGFVTNQARMNVGIKSMKPVEDDTTVRVDRKMYQYHKENPSNLLMPYTGVCSGFFFSLNKKGKDAVKDSPYYTEENLRFAEKAAGLCRKYESSLCQVLLGYFTVQEIPCVALYGPGNAESLEDAIGIFEKHFDKADYADYLIM